MLVGREGQNMASFPVQLSIYALTTIPAANVVWTNYLPPPFLCILFNHPCLRRRAPQPNPGKDGSGQLSICKWQWVHRPLTICPLLKNEKRDVSSFIHISTAKDRARGKTRSSYRAPYQSNSNIIISNVKAATVMVVDSISSRATSVQEQRCKSSSLKDLVLVSGWLGKAQWLLKQNVLLWFVYMRKPEAEFLNVQFRWGFWA